MLHHSTRAGYGMIRIFYLLANSPETSNSRLHLEPFIPVARALTMVMLILMLLASGCGSKQATTTPVITTNPSTSPTSGTFGILSQTGQGLFVTNCATCHGTSGQGITNLGTPALWGPTAQLNKYITAQGLLNYVVSTKPPGSAGSLPHDTYIDVLCYLLIQNNDVSTGAVFNESQLNSIASK